MAWRKLAINDDPHRNVDETELDGVPALAQDCIINEFGHTVKRPGLQQWINLNTDAGIDGLYWWSEKGVLIATSGGRVFKVTDAAGTAVELTGSTLQSGKPTSFTNDATNIIMAAGGRINYSPLAGPVVQITDTDAPTNVTHVVYMDGYLLANVNPLTSNRIQFSDPNDITSWNAADFFAANANPDFPHTLHTGWRELLVGGKNSVEFWYDDGVTPFSRFQNGVLESGVLSPYSIARTENEWIWLTNKRQIVRMTAQTRQLDVISLSVHRQLHDFAAVSNAIAYTMVLDGYPLFICHFPSVGKTLVWNSVRNAWTEWGQWTASVGEYRRFPATHYAQALDWNYHLWGANDSGIIYKMSRDYVDDAGSLIRAARRTGWISHGTLSQKRSKELRIRMKRGVATASVTSPKMVVRWRDKNGAWGNDHEVSMGAVGETEYLARLYNLGAYRTRQWEFICSDNVQWILMDVEENVEADSIVEA